jgi:long-chain acyl-CoA synthetase
MNEQFQSPLHMLDYWVEKKGHEIFLRQPINGVYINFTWKQVKQQAQQIAGALRHLGLRPNENIAILSKNCAEWFITDLALMMGGYVSVPIYPTANSETIRYILEHSECKAIFIGKLDSWSDQEQAIGSEILKLSMPYDTMDTQYHWPQLINLGQPLVNYAMPTMEQIMTIIYTSGSTGAPKGAVHSYSSYSWAASAIKNDLNTVESDRFLSYLPLAHITERVYIEGTSIYSGCTVCFTEHLKTFMDDLKRASPTLFISVPRLWSLFQKSTIEKVGANKLNFLLSVPLVKYIVSRKIRDEMGLSSARLVGCGSAPIAPSILKWYLKIGIPICEAWGMTENCAYAIINHPFRIDKISTVGHPGTGCEIKVEDDELLFRSLGLMMGYYKQPEATSACFNEQGYFRTGDCVKVDEDNFVYITGRIKDNFKTTKGKYVSPVAIEKQLFKNIHVELVCVIGSGLNHPIGLVQLSEAAEKERKEDIRLSLKSTLDQLNQSLESHQVLGAIMIIKEHWSIDNDCLTPTLKIKRHMIEKKYLNQVSELRGWSVVWENDL